VAISGNGFFVVRNSITNDQFATRAGAFKTDTNGFLITDTGERVQGFSDAGLTTLGDLKIDTTGMPATSDPAAGIVSYTIDGLGKINVNLSDGTSFVRGQVLLQNFQDPSALVKQGNSLYSGGPGTGPARAYKASGTYILVHLCSRSRIGVNHEPRISLVCRSLSRFRRGRISDPRADN